MSKFLPLIGTVVVAFLAAFESNTQAWVGTHPEMSATLAVIIAAVLNILKSPVQK